MTAGRQNPGTLQPPFKARLAHVPKRDPLRVASARSHRYPAVAQIADEHGLEGFAFYPGTVRLVADGVDPN